jgi:cellulose synthase/poly-beta-1,6-N-acetylglucosamine synthase-like glycosyltransferase
MAFEYKLFKKYMKEIKTSGEDKELEFNFLKDGYQFEYLDDAIVLDEKTQKSDAFVKQRSRWLANQFLQAQLHFFISIKALLKGNFDFFDKALQHFLLPRILLLGTTFLISIILIIFNYTFAFLWLICFLIILLSLLISVPKRFINTKTLIAILSLPKGYISMILSMLQMKGATKNFVVTEKNYNQDNK